MKKRLIAFLLVLVLIVPCAAASAVTYYRLNTKSLRLWYLPDYDSRILDSYRQDWALTINKTVDSNWARVTFTNGVSGYMERKFLVRCKSHTAWISKDKTTLRHGPGEVFRAEGTLSQGTKVTVLTDGRNYSYIKSPEGYGYVANSRLSKKQVKAASSVPDGKSVNYTAWVVSNGGQVGLRSSKSTSSTVVFAKYSPGTKVTVTRECGDFVYVKVSDGKTGYMRSKYVSKNKPADLPAPKPGPATFGAGNATVSTSDGKKAAVYQGEGLGWSVVMRLANGTTVYVAADGKDPYWVKVIINDHAYYMQKKDLKK